ncbi:MAG TPA: hypothetical protein VGO62_14555 [Myxococcota bacterium]
MIAALALVALLAPAAVDEQARHVAVVDAHASNADPVLGRVVADAVADELKKLAGVSVVDVNGVRAMLSEKARKEVLACADAKCIAEDAAGLGVDDVVMVKLAQHDSTLALSVRRIDGHGSEVPAFSREHLVDGAAVLASVGPAIAQLFPDAALEPGAVRGAAPAFTERLDPPPLPTFLVVIGGVTTAALGVGTGIAWAINNGAYHHAKSTTDASVSGAVVSGDALAADIATVHASFAWALGLGVATVLVGAGTGVAVPYTDFHGYGAVNAASDAP